MRRHGLGLAHGIMRRHGRGGLVWCLSVHVRLLLVRIGLSIWVDRRVRIEGRPESIALGLVVGIGHVWLVHVHVVCWRSVRIVVMLLLLLLLLVVVVVVVVCTVVPSTAASLATILAWHVAVAVAVAAMAMTSVAVARRTPIRTSSDHRTSSSTSPLHGWLPSRQVIHLAGLGNGWSQWLGTLDVGRQ